MKEYIEVFYWLYIISSQSDEENKVISRYINDLLYVGVTMQWKLIHVLICQLDQMQDYLKSSIGIYVLFSHMPIELEIVFRFWFETDSLILEMDL